MKPEFVILDQGLLSYFVFALALIRMSGLVIIAPFFSSQLTPMKFRAGFAVFLALAIFPTARDSFIALEMTTLTAGDMMILAVQEMSIGLAIGFFSTIIFMAAQLAGDVAGQQIGFSMANVVDPLSNIDVSLVGYLMAQIGTFIFLVLNLHLYLILLLQKSYSVVGIGAWQALPYFRACVENLSLQVHEMFIAAVKLSMPIITVMLMMSVLVGFITRTMPQMNIMVLDMPIRVVVGLISVMLLMPVFCVVYGGVTGNLQREFLTGAESGVIYDMLEALNNAISDMKPPE